MRRVIGLAVVVLLSACGRDQPTAGDAGKRPADSAAAAPVADSAAAAPGAREPLTADSVMVRDTARTM